MTVNGYVRSTGVCCMNISIGIIFLTGVYCKPAGIYLE